MTTFRQQRRVCKKLNQHTSWLYMVSPPSPHSQYHLYMKLRRRSGAVFEFRLLGAWNRMFWRESRCQLLLILMSSAIEGEETGRERMSRRQSMPPSQNRVVSFQALLYCNYYLSFLRSFIHSSFCYCFFYPQPHHHRHDGYFAKQCSSLS